VASSIHLLIASVAWLGEVATIHDWAVRHGRSLNTRVRDMMSSKHQLTIVDVSLRNASSNGKRSNVVGLLSHGIPKSSGAKVRSLTATRRACFGAVVRVVVKTDAAHAVSNVAEVFALRVVKGYVGRLEVRRSVLGLAIGTSREVAVHLALSRKSGMIVVEVVGRRSLSDVGDAHG
jgi:hypothetical protein